LNPGPHGPEL